MGGDARCVAFLREKFAAHFGAGTGVGIPAKVRHKRSHGEIDVSIRLLSVEFGIALRTTMGVVRVYLGQCMYGRGVYDREANGR